LLSKLKREEIEETDPIEVEAEAEEAEETEVIEEIEETEVTEEVVVDSVEAEVATEEIEVIDTPLENNLQKVVKLKLKNEIYQIDSIYDFNFNSSKVNHTN